MVSRPVSSPQIHGLGLGLGFGCAGTRSWTWTRTLRTRGLGPRRGRVLSRCFDYLLTLKFFKNHRTATLRVHIIYCFLNSIILAIIILIWIFFLKFVFNTVLSHLCCPLQFMLKKDVTDYVHTKIMHFHIQNVHKIVR